MPKWKVVIFLFSVAVKSTIYYLTLTQHKHAHKLLNIDANKSILPTTHVTEATSFIDEKTPKLVIN